MGTLHVTVCPGLSSLKSDPVGITEIPSPAGICRLTWTHSMDIDPVLVKLKESWDTDPIRALPWVTVTATGDCSACATLKPSWVDRDWG